MKKFIKTWITKKIRNYTTPTEKYFQLLKEKHLIEDKRQIEILQRLDQLHKILLNYSPKTYRREIVETVKNTSVVVDVSVSSIINVPKSIYLFGGVGIFFSL
jgi:predicted ATPase